VSPPPLIFPGAVSSCLQKTLIGATFSPPKVLFSFLLCPEASLLLDRSLSRSQYALRPRQKSSGHPLQGRFSSCVSMLGRLLKVFNRAPFFSVLFCSDAPSLSPASFFSLVALRADRFSFFLFLLIGFLEKNIFPPPFSFRALSGGSKLRVILFGSGVYGCLIPPTKGPSRPQPLSLPLNPFSAQKICDSFFYSQHFGGELPPFFDSRRRFRLLLDVIPFFFPDTLLPQLHLPSLMSRPLDTKQRSSF